MHEAVEVELYVDKTGAPNILSMRSIYGEQATVPARCRELIGAEARRWRYRPFEDSRGPIAVRFTERISIYPPERWKTPRIEFPADYELTSARVVLERSACYGTCPVYRVELRGDGTSHYEGEHFVEVTGEQTGTISLDEFASLIEAFKQADFYSLYDIYEAPITDQAYNRITLELNGRSHTVTDYWGELVGMPSSVSALERRIDVVGRTSQWTGRN